MNKKYTVCVLGAGLLLSSSLARAALALPENVIEPARASSVQLSIYNNNLAFVRDTRRADLQKGANRLAFVGVSSQIRPETAMLWGGGIQVIEQNYNYNLINPLNILEGYVGKTVKTALYNEKTGETVYDQAEVLDASMGKPVLKFSYGIETDFPGRIIYDSVPEGLRTKPTLVIDLKNQNKAGSRDLELAYLTGGLSWKADYVADVKDDRTLSLNGWITLQNESGIDYNNASVQLVAGSVNQASYGTVRPMMLMSRKTLAAGMAMDAAVAENAALPASEAFADYYLYTLPAKTTIKDKQSKQVSLMVKDKVKYTKEYRLSSPLYISWNSAENEFTKANPKVIYKIENTKTNGLGEALPQGTIRFFESDSRGDLQFIGESRLSQLAEGEKTELSLGSAFDVYASGKISSVKKISDKLSEMTVEITFNNAKDKEVEVRYEQNFGGNWEIVSEELKSEKKNASTQRWTVDIPAHGKYVLKYTVRSEKKS